MIYIVDYRYTNHISDIRTTILDRVTTDITEILLSDDITTSDIAREVTNLCNVVRPLDIVLLPWSTEFNELINKRVEDLCSLCFVVVPAGNNGIFVENTTPQCVNSVILVGSINKKGTPALFNCKSLNRFRKIYYLPGTNVKINDRQVSGTSISSAIYCALLAKYIMSDKSVTIEQLIIDEIDLYTAN